MHFLLQTVDVPNVLSERSVSWTSIQQTNFIRSLHGFPDHTTLFLDLLAELTVFGCTTLMNGPILLRPMLSDNMLTSRVNNFVTLPKFSTQDVRDIGKSVYWSGLCSHGIHILVI